MSKKKISFILFVIICLSYVFPKDKISETSSSLTYAYTDWKEFYTDIIDASKKEIYQYSYISNTVYDDFSKKIVSIAESNEWTLISNKDMFVSYMNYTFYVVSPNGHITVLILTNSSGSVLRHEVANKTNYASMSMEFSSGISSTASSVSKNTKDNTTQKKSEAKNDYDEINKKFLEKTSKAFDEQLSFFDEEVPLKLTDFIKN